MILKFYFYLIISRFNNSDVILKYNAPRELDSGERFFSTKTPSKLSNLYRLKVYWKYTE